MVLALALSGTVTGESGVPAVSTGGNAMLAEVLAALERRGNVSAKLRYQSQMGEATQVGSGNYWQQGIGPQRVTRWEMQTQVAEESASYVQVFDGRYVWTDRHLPSGRKIHRLDVNYLKSRLAGAHPNSTDDSPWEELLWGTQFRGGISQLLAELLRRFEFDPPRATQLNGFPVEALVGHWRTDQLAELSPAALAALADPAAWPPQLPHHVLILVGQSNLFPYVVEYRSAADAQLAEELIGLRPAQEPLLRYEIFEVRFAEAIDSTVFQFKAGDVASTDETALVLERLVKQHASAAAEVAGRDVSEQRQ